MIFFILMAAVAVAIQLCMTALVLILSRQPGSAHLRTLAAITFLLAIFSAIDVVLPMADFELWTAPLARTNFAVATAVGCLLLVFVSQYASAQMGWFSKILLLFLAPAIPLSLFSQLLITGTEFKAIPLFDTTIAVPVLTLLGRLELLAILVAMSTASLGVIRQVFLRRAPYAWLYVSGLILFVACATEEVLVSLGVLNLPYSGDLGSVGLLLAIAAPIYDRFAQNNIRAVQANSALEKSVAQRSDELVQAREALLIAERHAALGQLAAGVGHEINNPLSYVSANLVYLHSRFTDEEHLEEEAEAVADAIDGVERIARIVSDLTVFAHSESNRRSISEPQRVIQVALRMVQAQRLQDVVFDVDAKDCPNAAIDESRFTQVLLNLLMNAVHASACEDDDAEKTIRIQAHMVGEQVRVTIEDQGCGIPKQDLTQIFDPLFTTKEVGQGTGLGLFVCKGIIDAVGGSLHVESAIGHGTTVTIDVPATSEVVAQPRIRSATPAPSARLAALRVYLVDDEKHVTVALTRLLRHLNIESENDSRKALEHLTTASNYDAIICDLMMPGVSGMQLYLQVCEANPLLADKFLFISGGAVGAEAEEFVQQENIRLLAKPIDGEELTAALCEIAGV